MMWMFSSNLLSPLFRASVWFKKFKFHFQLFIMLLLAVTFEHGLMDCSQQNKFPHFIFRQKYVLPGPGLIF